MQPKVNKETTKSKIMKTIEKISEEITVLVEYAGNACGSARVAEVFGVEDNDELKTMLSNFEEEFDAVEVDPEGATPEQDAKLDAILESYRKQIAHEDETHTIEDVELTKHGYHHDCLTYVADGKYCQFDGEFYVDKEGFLHHTHIFDDGIEKEIVVKY